MPIGYDTDASPETRIAAGYYVARRLQRAGEGVRSENVLAAVERLKAQKRATEDTAEAVEMAYADRDAADDDLDAVATQAGRLIAGDDPTNRKKAPHTLVFPEGVEGVTEASISQNDSTYRQFAVRVTEHLPADHAARQLVEERLGRLISEFGAMSASLDAAIGRRAALEAKLEAAELEFDQQLEKLFHSLAETYGGLRARKFFTPPRKKKRSGG